MHTPTISTGGIIVKKDERDYDLSKVGASLVIPDVYLPSLGDMEIENQGTIPACGSHAGTIIKNILAFHKGEKKRLSPRYLWHKIKLTDGHPRTAGTDIYSILKALRNEGACNFDLTGNDVSLSLDQYTDLIVTPEMEASAKLEKIDSFATIFSPSFEEMKRAIFINKAIIILSRVGQNMYRPSWKERDILPLSPDRYPMDSGHFYVGYGYDKEQIYWINMWSDRWGRKGEGYWTEDYVKWVNSVGTIIDAKFVSPIILPAFTRNLTLGYGGHDVKNLQIYLNYKGFPVASSGAGSKGNETTYFGNLTKQALSKFQASNNILPSVGFFGPLTRKFIEENR